MLKFSPKNLPQLTHEIASTVAISRTLPQHMTDAFALSITQSFPSSLCTKLTISSLDIESSHWPHAPLQTVTSFASGWFVRTLSCCIPSIIIGLTS